MNRIVVTGDTHGVIDTLKIDNYQQSPRKLDMSDYLIICGDCGVVWDNDTINDSIEYFQGFGTNILFVDGNHENFDLLNAFLVTNWNGGKVHKLGDGVYHLMRGQVFEICGKKFLTIGGADSSDRESRIAHVSWWSDERIVYEDIKEANQNLEKVNYKVDYVITHTPSTKTLNDFIGILTQCGEAIPYYLQKKVISTPSSDMLDWVNKNVRYKQWFCGHLHIDEIIKKVQILYSEMVEIK